MKLEREVEIDPKNIMPNKVNEMMSMKKETSVIIIIIILLHFVFS